jgi:hypothetical protein
MAVLWVVAGVLLEVIHTMGNDRVVFTEVPISVSDQDMERYHKTSRTHFHKINGKVVFCFILYECTNVQYFFNRTELCGSNASTCITEEIYLLMVLYQVHRLYTFEDRKIVSDEEEGRGSGLGLFEGTVPATGWRDWEKL